MTITLPPDLQPRLEQEKRPGEDIPTFIERMLRERLAEIEAEKVEESDEEDELTGGTMADLFAGRVGLFRSNERVPGGARMSENTGKQFAEGMAEKQRQGHL